MKADPLTLAGPGRVLSARLPGVTVAQRAYLDRFETFARDHANPQRDPGPKGRAFALVMDEAAGRRLVQPWRVLGRPRLAA